MNAFNVMDVKFLVSFVFLTWFFFFRMQLLRFDKIWYYLHERCIIWENCKRRTQITLKKERYFFIQCSVKNTLFSLLSKEIKWYPVQTYSNSYEIKFVKMEHHKRDISKKKWNHIHVLVCIVCWFSFVSIKFTQQSIRMCQFFCDFIIDHFRCGIDLCEEEWNAHTNNSQ